ncbi:uncharacterized protein LOC129302939 [Prosopis cineraria]|uniref:uncharacterized protein LOC129302939 n=1 Tax=Prosopis cineraria TaxID=364024 RepID=UPI00240FB51E|nr:uncharacterized protein LOC129302939 [Prosopis cineraria]
MALQAGVQTSKILILVGAGLTGSVVLRSGRLSDLIQQLQELLKGVDEAEISPGRYDTAAIAAQIRQLAQEIRELTISNPVTIFNGNSSSNGSYASYILPAAAIGAMGYCYMWWKGWSFSDVMFVTKRNMANAVATVSKQLENVHETLASTRRHLTKKLEVLDLKVEGHNELTQLIANDVTEVKSNLSQIGGDFELIHEMISSLEGKLKLVESKQDITNSGLWYLCQLADGFKEQPNSKIFKEVSTELASHSTMALEGKSSLKGLQFITETTDTVQKSVTHTKKGGLSFANEKEPLSRARIHRSFPVNVSLGRDIIG